MCNVSGVTCYREKQSQIKGIGSMKSGEWIIFLSHMIRKG